MAANGNEFEATLYEILETINRNSSASQELNSGVCGHECVICRLVRESTLRSIKVLFAEFVNDIKARDSVRGARGFCGEHAKLVADLGDSLGVAILYADLADQTRMRWTGTLSSTARKMFQRPRRANTSCCPACISAMEATDRYSKALATGLENSDVWAVFEDESKRSCGTQICVTHTERIIDAAKRSVGQRFAQLQAHHLARLQSELEEIVRKNDYRSRGEAWGPERDAWLRALKRVNRD